MKIVIIESASKQKKLTKLLGSIYGSGQFRVTASLGHVRDLPAKELGVDVDRGFRPHYVTSRGKASKIKSLRKAVSEAEAVYLAADPDREGESIAWHLVQVTHPTVPVYRVSFNEITKSAVQEAFATPRQIDMDLVAAQEARRILDRLVGYKLSPALWQGLDESGLSAGRVQSVALKLVVERQQAIDTFEVRDYWSIVGTFAVPEGQFDAKMIIWQGHQWQMDTFKSQAEVEQAISSLTDTVFKIQKIEVKDRLRKPFAPFTTSTLQQAASTHLKISPDKTMSIAQALYEAGHITYMRTDSPAVSDEAADMAETLIRQNYGEVYLPEKRPIYKAKSGSQEAHECVRPTDLSVSDLSTTLDDFSAKLYRLIWQRFIASQMAAAHYERTTIYVAGGHSLFMTRNSTLKYDGFLRVYTYGNDLDSDDETDNEQEIVLPPVAQDQVCRIVLLAPEQHFTRPPATYSEASLVNALEKAGVGRPSTYSMMVSTIRHRKYVKLVKRRLVPTALGQRVIGFLNENFALVMSYDFTKTMEDALDKIALGELDTRKFLGLFWEKFEPLIEPWQHTTPQRVAPQLTDETCPVCSKGQLQLKSSKKGRFFGCNRYPKCKYSRDVKAAKPVLIGQKCPKCQAQLCVRSKKDRDDKFVACTAYPACRYTQNFQPDTIK
ncbi:MAG: type I DNA topoisomerase [Chloroflexota bacterium]